ncbi:MAG: NHLP bacteriocin export ABC transporter permease/ATPase subunit [Acidimicrobiia bacterium]|nr:NHLP bacteriocin export ABC transporter permease/ATPase subunit [Acidimicrobiia bacterium]
MKPEILQPGRPFPLHGEDCAWKIEEGALDLFLVEMEGEEPVGARVHLLRVEAGRTVFAFPPEAGGGRRVVAVAGEQTRLTRIEAAAGVPEVDAWKRMMAARLPELAARDGEPGDFRLWQSEALRLAVDSAGQEEVERERRLRAKAEMERRSFDQSLRSLASPLHKEAGQTVAAALSDALYAAMQRVAEAQGITLKRPSGQALDPVAAIARASGIRYRRTVLRGAWWKQDNGPLLAFAEAGNRPLALVPQSGNRYQALDPSSGSAEPVDAKLAPTLSGVAYCFYRPFPQKSLSAMDVFRFGLEAARGDLAAILIAGMLSGMIAMATPIATGELFDSVIPGAERGLLLPIGGFLLLVALSTALFTVTRNLAFLRMEGKMDARVQAAVWDRLLALPVPFFRDYSSGDLASRSMAVSEIRRTLTGSALSSLVSGVFSVFSFGLLFYYGPQLVPVAIVAVVIAIATTVAASRLRMRVVRELAEVDGKLSGVVFELISGVAKFRLSGAESRAFAAWSKDYSHYKRLAFQAGAITNRFAVFDTIFPTATTAAIFYFAARAMAQPGADAMTTGQFLAFNAAFGQFLGAALALSGTVLQVVNIVPTYERAKPILETLPEVPGGAGDPGVLSGAVEVQHVAFRYAPPAPLVLHDISLRIEPGEFVAFVGESGCGKSTLMRLLLGFEKPESGAIYFDRHNLAGLDLQAVRRQMGVVLQNSRLITGDIFSNIVGSSNLTIEDAWEAARMAGLDEDLKTMPMGMHTVIAETAGLSGGQRQRLLIARAIVHRPRILIFDEATSALDNRTQEIVSRSLESLQATRIVIAHRLSTILNADRIFVLEGGRIAESGTYSELMAAGGAFAALARRQIA